MSNYMLQAVTNAATVQKITTKSQQLQSCDQQVSQSETWTDARDFQPACDHTETTQKADVPVVLVNDIEESTFILHTDYIECNRFHPVKMQ